MLLDRRNLHKKEIWPIEIGVGVVMLVFVHPAIQQLLATAVAYQVPFRSYPLWKIPASVRILKLANGRCHTDSRGSSFIACVLTVARR